MTTQNVAASWRGLRLSLGQEALLFLHQIAPESSAYNTSFVLNLHFPVDAGILATAVERAAGQNDILNSVIRNVAGEARRFPGAAVPTLEVHEAPPDDRSARAFAEAFTRRPFRLERQPPVRAALVRRVESADLLVVAVHHIAVDNLSQRFFLQEILDQYVALSSGSVRAVADTGADFDQFVRREREFLTSSRAASASAYWQRELESARSDACLPTDLPRPEMYRFAGAEIDRDFPPGLMADVESTASRENVTPFVFLLAIFQLLLHTLDGRTDFLIGVPVTVRPSRDFRKSIGYFVNTLPLRGLIDPDASFSALLRGTAGTLLRGLMHRDYPFALMPRLVAARPEPSRAGLVSVMFTMDMVDPEAALPILAPGGHCTYDSLVFSEFYVPQQLGQFDLTLQTVWGSGYGRLQLKYNTSLFTAATAEKLAGRYLGLLRSSCRGALPPRLHDLDFADEGA